LLGLLVHLLLHGVGLLLHGFGLFCLLLLMLPQLLLHLLLHGVLDFLELVPELFLELPLGSGGNILFSSHGCGCVVEALVDACAWLTLLVPVSLSSFCCGSLYCRPT
jgi:hypothetical protein